MSYIRTFFENPLLDYGAGAGADITNRVSPQQVVAIDFEKISAVSRECAGSSRILVYLETSATLKFIGADAEEFLKVFAEYCRDKRSLERSAVRFLGTDGARPEMPKLVGEQKIVHDPKKQP